MRIFWALAILLCLAVGNVTAQIDTMNLKEVEITSSRHQRSVDDSPEVMQIITADEIQAMNVEGIGDILERIPGITAENGTGSGFPNRSIISMNGFPANYTLVLVNGSRLLSEHFHTGTNTELIHVDEIERIEILRGASSSQYGSDAIAGIVNIITKCGSDEPEVLFSAEAGSYDTYGSDVSVTGTNKSGKVTFASFISHKQSHGVPIISPAHRVGAMGYTTRIFSQRIGASFSPKIQGDFWLRFADNQMKFSGEASNSYLLMPNAHFTFALKDNFTLHTKLGYTEWYAETSSEHNRLLRPEIWSVYKLNNKHYLTFGVDYAHQTFTRSAVLEQSQGSAGIFVQDNFLLTDKITIDGAIRVDLPDNIDPVFSPKLSLLFSPTGTIDLRAGASRGFHAPSLQDLYEEGYGHGGSARRFGNPDLKPEYSTSLWFDATYKPTENLWFNTGVFYSMIDNFIVPVFDGMWEEDTTKEVWRRTNILQANIYSFSASVSYTFLNAFTFDGSYSISDSKSIDNERLVPYNPGTAIDLKLTARQFQGRKVEVSEFVRLHMAQGRYAWSWKPDSEYDLGDPSGLTTNLNDYNKLDAGINIAVNQKYLLQLSVENLLGEDIQNLDDALMEIDGEPVYRAAVKMRF